MRRFRNIWFVLAAFFWLPVSAHCQIEALPGFEFIRCSAEEHSPGESNGKHDCSNCCAAEKSQCQLNHGRLTIPVPELIPVALLPVRETTHALPFDVTLGILTAAPPEFPQSWHFLARTALPVRAPSFVS